MAIESIKNNGAGISAPVKSSQKTGVTEKSFDLTLSEVKATTAVESTVVTATEAVVFKNTFNNALAEIKATPRESSIDNERVAKIKEAIENGTYQINPDRIASKMVQFEFLWYK